MSTLSLGEYGGAILRDSGTVSAWSWDQTVHDVLGLSDATEVRGNDSGGCARRKSGGVWCWPERTDREPVRETDPERLRSFNSAPDSAGGACHADPMGALRCTGTNLWGELGDGSALITPTPTSVPGLSGVLAVDINGSTCALRADGSVWCWGGEPYGEPPAVDRSLPTPVLGVTGATELHVPCARRRDASVVCWDDTRWGRNVSETTTPSPLITVRTPRLSQFDTGGLGGCGVTPNGRVCCWDPADPSGLARRVQGMESVVELAMGAEHACARLKSGSVSCWGFGAHGQLGDGNRYTGVSAEKKVVLRTPLRVPVSALGVTSATALWAGEYQTCVQTAEAGAPFCFGNLAHHPTPEGPYASLIAAPVPELRGLSRLAMGHTYDCGLDSAGAVRCKGKNTHAVLGTNEVKATAHTVIGSGASWLAAGPMHACAVREGRVLCWGDNAAAELGLGTWLRNREGVRVQWEGDP